MIEKEGIKEKKKEKEQKRLIYALLTFPVMLVLLGLGHYLIAEITNKPITIEQSFMNAFVFAIVFSVMSYAFNTGQKPDEYVQQKRTRTGAIAMLITVLLLALIGFATDIEMQLEVIVTLFIITFGLVYLVIYGIGKLV